MRSITRSLLGIEIVSAVCLWICVAAFKGLLEPFGVSSGVKWIVTYNLAWGLFLGSMMLMFTAFQLEVIPSPSREKEMKNRGYLKGPYWGPWGCFLRVSFMFIGLSVMLIGLPVTSSGNTVNNSSYLAMYLCLLTMLLAAHILEVDRRWWPRAMSAVAALGFMFSTVNFVFSLPVELLR